MAVHEPGIGLRRYTLAEVLGLLLLADLPALAASGITFDPSGTPLSEEDVQAAIGELAALHSALAGSLGSAAGRDVGTAAGDLPELNADGRLDLARLGSGTPSASNFLRGDGSFASITSGLGVGQTWQDVTASRAYATTYTNSTGKPIFVNVGSTGVSGGTVQLDAVIDGATAFAFAFEAAGSNFAQAIGNFVVPAGSTYRVNMAAGGAGLLKWMELR